MLAMSDDRSASVADIVVDELRKKEINRPIRLPKRDFLTRGQKLKVKDPWHILSGYDLEFAGMSTRERVRVMPIIALREPDPTARVETIPRSREPALRFCRVRRATAPSKFARPMPGGPSGAW